MMNMDPNDYETILLGSFEKEKSLKIRLKLLVETKESLIEFLKRILSLFAWKVDYMLGISPNIIMYELNVDHIRRPIQKRKKDVCKVKCNVIKIKVNSLKQVG